MQSPYEHWRDELMKEAPGEGTRERDEYLHIVDQIARLQFDIANDIRCCKMLQCQITSFDEKTSYYALAQLCEQLGYRARVIAQHEYELQWLQGKLNRLCEAAAPAYLAREVGG